MINFWVTIVKFFGSKTLLMNVLENEFHSHRSLSCQIALFHDFHILYDESSMTSRESLRKYFPFIKLEFSLPRTVTST